MKQRQPTLISFLGKSALTKQGYRKANYQIDDKSYETSYFGFALTEHIKPKKIILLGTAGSMWDVLIEAHAEDDDAENRRLTLLDLAEKQQVDESILQEVTPIIEKHLNCEVEMKIIPYARTTEEQIGILSSIANSIPENESIIMDVTHGFRHLPMLGMLAAHYLERIKNAQVEGIYYGALEMTVNDETPVLNLKGLLQTMNWIQAITAYDASGNYNHFTGLLKQEGWSDIECNNLHQAAFYERTTNIIKAKEKLSSINQALDKQESSFLKLFGEELQKRLSWWRKDSRADWEANLANTYFKRGDYLRSSIFLQEACISNNLHQSLCGNFKERENKRKEMQRKDNIFKKLAHLRNSMAHGVKGQYKSKAEKPLKDENILKSTIGDMIKNWKSLGKKDQNKTKSKKNKTMQKNTLADIFIEAQKSTD